VDLVSSCLLNVDGKHRPSLAAALEHPYLASQKARGEMTPASSKYSCLITNDVQQTPKACACTYDFHLGDDDSDVSTQSTDAESASRIWEEMNGEWDSYILI